MANFKILTIIVTYNAMHWVDCCLSSVAEISHVLVIDNGSTDGTQCYINKHYPHVKLIQNNKNMGFGRANNIGLQMALDGEYDYVYLLNQDAWIMPDTLTKMIAVNQAHPEYGVLSPFQIQGNTQHLDANFSRVVTSIQCKSSMLEDFYFNRLADFYDVPFVMAAHWLISKKCLMDVGGFSPTFSHYGEDNNYVNRALYHGYKIAVVPGAIGIHDREHREFSINAKMHLVNTEALYKLSRIYDADRFPMLYFICRSIIYSIRFFSLKPLCNLFKVILNYRTVKNNTVESKKNKCAFLSLD